MEAESLAAVARGTAMTENGINTDLLIDANRYFVRLSPFHEGTREAGCRSYDHINGYFSGVDYGHSFEGEFTALQERAVLYDTAIQRQLILLGPDAGALADYVFTRDLTTLESGRARYGYICREDGVIITDAVISRIATNEYWVSPTVADVLLWLAAIALKSDWQVEVFDSNRATARIEGKHANALMREALGGQADEIPYYSCRPGTVGDAEVLVSRTASGPLPGFDIYCSPGAAMQVWRALLSVGAAYGLLVKGWGALDHSTMLEAGVLFFSYEINCEDRVTPLELPRRFVDLDASDFIGRDALLVVESQGGPSRRLCGLIGSDQLLVPPAGRWNVVRDGEPVGFSRWWGWSPTLNRNIGYAVLRNEVDFGTTVDVHFEATEEATSVARLPFVEPAR
jgi:glycine cleavage system aminomethyltransferase T